MPTISMFYGIIIKMHMDDHNPPHFHAFYNEYHLSMETNGNILEGTMSPKQLKMISAWAAIHEEELNADWILSKEGSKPYKIDPLK